jgi:hypothetical protein
LFLVPSVYVILDRARVRKRVLAAPRLAPAEGD